MDVLKDRIKKHEGFVNEVYNDSLGKRTVGYGHLCVEDHWENNKKYTEEFLSGIFDEDFANANGLAMKMIGDIPLKQNSKEVIIEMCFQLGNKVSKFVKMWQALKNKDYQTASLEMLDSNWHKQTPKRCESLAQIMRQDNQVRTSNYHINFDDFCKGED
jgi:GH24 family phage-related lysozyme (muramidase)